MASLIYTAITSLDGFISDENGNFDWAAPDDEVHAFINDLERPISTYLYGRRLYETMAPWETMEAPQGSVTHDFAALWRAADKIVYSTALRTVLTSKTCIARFFDPAEVARLKHDSPNNISIGGAALGRVRVSRRTRRRVPLVYPSRDCRRRQSCASRQCPPRSGVARPATVS